MTDTKKNQEAKEEKKAEGSKKVSVYNKYNTRIRSVASKSESCAVLCGVYFTKDCSVATDGKVLIKVTTEKHDAGAFPSLPGNEGAVNLEHGLLVTSLAVEMLEKSIPKNNCLPLLNNAWVSKEEKDSVKFVTTNLESVTPTIVKQDYIKYPDYEQVIPTKKADLEIWFDPLLLINLLKCFLTNSGKYDIDKVKFSFNGPLDSVKVEGNVKATGQKITGVIAPCRE